MKKILFGLVVGGVIGFALGIYSLPILIEWRAANDKPITEQVFTQSDPKGQFDRNSPGSDALHWGEGTVRISSGKLFFGEDVKLAPGPDYRIYLTKKFVDTRDGFSRIKSQALQISKLKTFSGPLEFELPADINLDEFDNVIVWCEAFSQYIASARLD